MSSIDERIVRMLFDNTSFEHNAAASLVTLAQLNKGLQLEGATKGLSDIDEASKHVSLEPLANGLESVTHKFTAMSVVGYAALATITSKIVDMGVTMAKSFTIEPIKAGFQNYETQINAVQTILANTAAEGTKIGDVNKALAQLNTYANQTIYNFSEMTQNIGTFTAAGVDLKTSVESIKGIANLAAISGSNSQQASMAMYQLSQAIASGTVKLQDWNSVVNAGLGGKTFQTALENTARASGVAIDSIVKKAGGFRNSLQEGWLTSDVLTKTLAQFTGDLSAAQIKAMGFTKQQAAQIQAMGQTAVNAATKIKTMTQLADALKEEVATAYGAIFKTIFGDIGQATDLFTSVHNAAENALTGPIYALNTLLQGWAQLGGRTVLIQAITEAFQELGAVLKPIKDAFREVFPPATAAEIYTLTYNFRAFIEQFKIGDKASKELGATFLGIFDIVKVVFDVVGKLAHVFGNVFGLATQGSGSILDFTANLSTFAERLRKAVETGKGFSDFLSKLQTVLSAPVLLLQAFGQYVKEIIDKFDGNKLASSFDGVAAKLGPIGKLNELLNESFGTMFQQLIHVGQALEPIANKVIDFFGKVGQAFFSVFTFQNWQVVIDTLKTGLLGGLLITLRNFVTKFKSGGGEGFQGLAHSIEETFDSLTKTLETMQGTLKAATLLEIAAAIGLLTISVVALSKVDSAGLTRASASITVMFTQLIGSMAIFQKFIGSEDFLKMPIMMGSLLLLAGALDIMVTAVTRLARLDWEGVHKGVSGLSIILTVLAGDIRLMGSPERMISVGLGLTSLAKGVEVLGGVVVTLSGLSWTEMAKGLGGVATLLIGLALFSKLSEANAAGAIQGYGIVLLATGIKILAIAMKDFGALSWTEIAKGLLAMAGGLAAMGIALKFIPPSSVFSAAGVLIVATSLGMIGDAIKKMGDLKSIVIAKGLVAMAGGLALIAGALFILPPSTLLSAAAIFIVATSLGMLADALVKMGGQSWNSVAKGLVELSGALAIIAVALILMEASLPGAAALVVVAGALAILAPVMEGFGQMSWGDVATSLVELAGVFVILGVAGLVMAPITPVLLLLGEAIALIGAGALEAGLALFVFSAAIAALSVSGAAGVATMVLYFTAIINLMPKFAEGLGLAFIAFAKTLGQAGPAITDALVAIIGALLDAIAKLGPKIILTFYALLDALLTAANKYIPHMVSTGIQLMSGILEGIAKNIPSLAKSGKDMIVAWLKAIGDNLPDIVQSAFDLIIRYTNALGEAIKKNSGPLGDAAGNMAVDIIEGLVTGIQHGAGKVVDAIENVASNALDSAASWLGINSPSKEFAKIGHWSVVGWANGMTDSSDIVSKATNSVAKNAVEAMSKSIAGIANAANLNMDLTPTITPVLDLSNIKKGSAQIGGMLGSAAISVDSTYAKATIVSAGYVENQAAVAQFSPAQPNGTTLNFTQNNTSPKALSATDIYRQTNNQLSVARGVLVYQSGGTE